MSGRAFLVAVVLGAALVVAGAAAPSDSRRALANSALLALGATAISLPLGTLLAILLARFPIPGRRAAAAALGVLLVVPLYVQLAGWDAAFGKLGWFTLACGSMADPLLAGMRGAIFVHGMAAAPWVAAIVGLGLLQIDPAQEEAALLVATPAVVLRRVTLPQAWPFVLAAAIFSLINTIAEMTVTNIYLIRPAEQTYTERFYMTFSLTADASQAALAAGPAIAALASLLVAALWMVARVAPRQAPIVLREPLQFPLYGWRRGALAAVLWLVVGWLTAQPLASLFAKAGFVVVQSGGDRVRSWSLVKCMREVASAPWYDAPGWGWTLRFEFRWTLLIAVAAAAVALMVGTALGWLARRGGRWAAPAIVVSAAGLAVPGPLVAVTLIWLLNRDLAPAIVARDGSWKSWLLVLYDETPLAPILAQAVRASPLATLIIWHSFRTLPRDVLDAAALAGLSPARVFWRVALPLRWRALAAAGLLALAIAAGDLAWSLLVLPPGVDTVQRRVFGLVHSGVEEQVAAIALVQVLAYALLVMGAAICASRLLSRTPRRRA